MTADILTPQEDWYILEKSVRENRIILILGPYALEVEYQDTPDGPTRTAFFYDIVAAELLKQYDLPEEMESAKNLWPLHHAVTCILQNRLAPEQKVRREVTRLISEIGDKSQPSRQLCALAALPQLSLFVSLSPDAILEKALKATKTSRVQTASFSPKDSTETLYDLRRLNPNECGLFQLFGSCQSVGSNFAMHEEDVLEYLFKLQTDGSRRSLYVLSELRRRDILFIGCNFPDWLGRAMLRLVNEDRLFAKETQEFLCSETDDPNFSTFLSHFSPNSLMYYGGPQAFMAKLIEKFGNMPANEPPPQPSIPASRPGPTVFISYASENTESAKRIADILLTLGFNDVWLDKKKLKSGHDWSDRIDDAIETCDYFMPLLSLEADSRKEGVFWAEWVKAIERKSNIHGRFILPVIIDAEKTPKQSYIRISQGLTKEFFDWQINHAPWGELDTRTCEDLRELCESFGQPGHD